MQSWEKRQRKQQLEERKWATHIRIFRNSCQIRNMCSVDRLVILHPFTCLGTPQRGVKGIAVEWWEKKIKADMESACLLWRAFYPVTQTRPWVMKSPSLSGLHQNSCDSLHFTIYKTISSSFWCKRKVAFSFLQWLQHVRDQWEVVAINVSAG